MMEQQKERTLEAEEEDDQGSERSVVEEVQELEETHPEAEASSAHSPLWVLKPPNANLNSEICVCVHFNQSMCLQKSITYFKQWKDNIKNR